MNIRQTFFLLVLSLLSWCTINAQTEVSGGIFTPTTWNAANSPYIVTDDIVVFPNQSLTIEPGTEIRVAANKRIELRAGSLFANGTAAAPIIFTIDEEISDTTGKWQGIESTTSLFTPINIELNHAVVEYAKTGIQYNGGGYRFADNVTFRYNDLALYDGGQGYDWITISNAVFHDNLIGTYGRVSLLNCNLYDNVQATVDLNSFANSTEGGRITDCTFTNNEACIAREDLLTPSAYISNSTFTNNDVVATIYRVNASNSTFSGSTTHALYFAVGTIENCTFTENNLGIRTVENPDQAIIQFNDFFNNNIGIQIDGPGAEIHFNNICDNDAYGVFVTSPNPINITQNCWCTTDESLVADYIFDAFDEVDAGIATFLPINNNCLDALIYPGDANSNGQANAWDLLPIGLHYGASGSARENPNTNWSGTEANDWSTEMITGLNAKHADTDGNGLINTADVNAILDNYNLTHSQFEGFPPVVDNQNTFALALSTPEIIQPGQTVSFGLEIGEVGNAVPDFYGIAFALTAEVEFFELGSFSLTFADSWLGTPEELLTIYREFPDDNRIEVAIVRKDGQPRTGYGKIADLNFVMSEDLIISLETAGLGTNTDPQIRVRDIEAVNHEGTVLTMEASPVEIIIVSNENITRTQLQIFPNPAREQLTLAGISAYQSLNLYNNQGVLVANYRSNELQLDLSGLPAGLYHLQLLTTEGELIVQKISIQ